MALKMGFRYPLSYMQVLTKNRKFMGSVEYDAMFSIEPDTYWGKLGSRLPRQPYHSRLICYVLMLGYF